MNARVRDRIADPARLAELEHEMTHGDLYGMQTFDQSLVQLYRNGLVASDDALAHAEFGERDALLPRPRRRRARARAASVVGHLAGCTRGGCPGLTARQSS